MLKKEARQITGGLSAPNKMPGPSINLPAWNCITGLKLQAVKGSVCAGCYAMKGRYRFKNVKDALDRRLTALTDPRWVDAMVTLITGEKYFRWHDSGDIQSIEHLENIFRVCRRTPETQHWMPTREAQFIKRLKVNQVPRNLIIRFSSHMIDQGPVNFWPWTSTVVTAGKTCPAAEQNNECKDCRQCWDRSVKNVAYGKH
jgi:hypothetical protein